MIIHNMKLFFGILLSVAIGSGAVSAENPYRPATHVETAYYEQVMTSLTKAVADGPPGWEVTSRQGMEPLSQVALGVEKAPLVVSYHVTWQDTPRIVEAEDKLGVRLIAEQEHPKPNPERDALADRSEELTVQLEAAEAQEDMTKVWEVQKQLDSVKRKLNAIYTREDEERNQLIRSMQPRDVTLRLTMIVNQTDYLFTEPAVKEKPVAGSYCYRTPGDYTPGLTWREGKACVFLGKGWDFLPKGGGMKYTFTRGLPHTVAQNVIVIVQADPARTQAFLDGMDWRGLKKLIGK